MIQPRIQNPVLVLELRFKRTYLYEVSSGGFHVPLKMALRR